MEILAIDIGSYSVKFLQFETNKSRFILNGVEEIEISKYLKDYELNNLSKLEAQIHIISYFIDKFQKDESKSRYRIIANWPSEYVTTRYLTLVGNNKSKAEMMIPFQLEEDLPFSLSDTQFVSKIYKKDGPLKAMVNITKLSSFGKFYEDLKEKETTPHLLCSEASLIGQYAESLREDVPYGIIDIGHHSTKIYFINNKEILANHVSFIGGETITQAIEINYQLESHDAYQYKHDNCFFLTNGQMSDVDSSQKEFAELMKRTVAPLLSDIIRYELGFRVRQGHKVKKYFITGGSSKIKNIDNFLAQELSTEVEYLHFNHLNTNFVIPDDNQLFQGHMMSYALTTNQAPLSFFKGKYTVSLGDEVSIYSTAFMGIRVLAISIALTIGLMAERYFLTEKETRQKSEISKLTKVPELNVTKKELTLYKTKPESLLNFFIKKERSLDTEAKAISSTSKINAILPLIKLNQIIASDQTLYELTEYEGQNKSVNGTFVAEDIEELRKLKELLEASGLTGIKTKLNEEQKFLQFNFNGD